MKTLNSTTERRASEPLILIEEVVNTRFGRTYPDSWKSPEQMRVWLIDHKILAEDTPLTQADHRRMLEVREALRALLRQNNGIAIAPENIETLNFLAKHAPLTVRFDQQGQAELIPD
ncbi:MAG TPA: ABATE domain-containing protein, partial [Ktedonobacteraceae bacterium]|nr:ABATE domain-containing protein [Ktedonobacteraceae bacterium]